MIHFLVGTTTQVKRPSQGGTKHAKGNPCADSDSSLVPGLGGAAGDAREVRWLPDGRRQKAAALGPHRRVHALGGGLLPPRAGHQRPPLHRGDHQLAGNQLRSGPLQRNPAAAGLPPEPHRVRSGAVDRPAEGRVADHVQHPLHRNRLQPDGARVGVPAGHRGFGLGKEHPGERDFSAGSLAQSRRSGA